MAERGERLVASRGFRVFDDKWGRESSVSRAPVAWCGWEFRKVGRCLRWSSCLVGMLKLDGDDDGSGWSSQLKSAPPGCCTYLRTSLKG